MRLLEDPPMDQIYREMRTLTTLRLRAAAHYDIAWIDALEHRRQRCADELARVCGAAGHDEQLLTAA